MFIIAINVEYCCVAVGKMFKTVFYNSRIGTDVSGYYTYRASGLPSPLKFFRPSVQMKIGN
jgi:hypothetical protein